MIKLFSSQYPYDLCHIIYRRSEINGRTDIAPEEEFLQLASLRLSNGQTFRAHQHVWKDPEPGQIIAQESWVVIQGRVRAMLYDVDGTHFGDYDLEPGDCSLTFFGGHNYLALEEDTLVYEYKTGPYRGQTLDKVFL